MSVSELLHGAESVIGELDPVPITEAVARVHAQLWSDLEARGESLGAHDLWIAATALAHGFGVLTNDRRGFDRVHGLRVVAP